jgi:hypothetical protein
VAGKRRIRDRAKEADALTGGNRILAMLNERAPVFSQTEDATLFRAAKTVLNGVAPVDEAARPYALAIRALGGASIMDAVAAYKRTTPAKFGRALKDLQADYLKTLEGNVSVTYLDRLKNRLGRFVRKFCASQIHTITKNEIEDWIAGLNWNPAMAISP